MSWFTDALKDAAKGLVGGLPGAAIGLGTSIIGSLVSNRQAKSNQNSQNEWQAEQARIARDWQSDQAAQQNAWSEKMNLQQQAWQEGMWNKTNEWNSESARMQRLLDAGVNPNNAAGLISGNQSVAQLAQQPLIPNANPLPSTSIPNGGQFAGAGVDLTGGVFQGMAANKEMQMMDAQRHNIEADTASKLQGAEKDKALEQVYKDQAMGIQLDNYYKPQQIETELNSMREAAHRDAALAAKTEKETEQLTYIIDEILPLEKRMSLTNIDEAVSRIAEHYQNVRTGKATEAAEYSRKGLLDKQAEGQAIQNKYDKRYGWIERIQNIGRNSEEIRNLHLTNEEQESVVASLHAYGIDVNKEDIDPLMKIFLMSRLDGYGDKESLGASTLAGYEIGKGMKNKGDELFSKALDILGNILAAKIGGKALGSGLRGSGTPITPTPSPTGGTTYNWTRSTYWKPSYTNR